MGFVSSFCKRAPQYEKELALSFLFLPSVNLEGKFHNELLNRVQDKWLNDIDCVVEFGCGTGHNLQKIRNKNPNIIVYGSDWAGSSQKILEKNNIPSWNFDMKKCNGRLPKEIFDHDAICFLTVGSLEQL